MFYVLEIQENVNNEGSYLITSHNTKEEALSKWHTILSYAAVSQVYLHTAVVINNLGEYIARETYKHDIINE